MTPLFSGISGLGVNFGLLDPQKNAFFTDFGSYLRKMRAFPRKVPSLEVAMKLKVLQFTFSSLVYLGISL
jgi:hypothetical protein